MRRHAIALALLLGCLGDPRPAVASSPILWIVGQDQATGTLGLAWDPSPPAVPPAPNPSGYKVLIGTASRVYTMTQDVGLATTATITLPRPPDVDQTYYFAVVAYNVSGEYTQSDPSNEVAATFLATGGGGPPAPDPRCAFPTGDRAVSVFPTRLQDTIAGTRSTISFQLASPNSPIVLVEIRLNGLAAKAIDARGAPAGDLTDVGAAWFPRPTAPGRYAITIYARNAYGCDRDQATTFVIVK